ncbi:MAG: SGNH/GDSL hydrolase family protein [Opitutales bacterium]|nr:SGNH/GDSL hydrolase family protein [Opitutales bacterium]
MELTENSVVLFQGDSITDCWRNRGQEAPNTGLGGGYAARVAGDLLDARPGLGLRFYNRGISGNRVVDLYARWRMDAVNLRPDLISILIGVNDTWHGFKQDNGVEVPRYAQVYRMLLDYTRECLPNVGLVLMEPFVLPVGEVEAAWVDEMQARREAVRKIAEDYGAVFVPLQEPLEDAARRGGGPVHWLSDGVHPTPAGHALIAREWLRATGL